MPVPLPPPPPSSSKSFIRISSLLALSNHLRHHLTLRTLSPPTTYHRLLLFRLASPSADQPEIYCMEATCPHLGAPLSHAPISVPSTPAPGEPAGDEDETTDGDVDFDDEIPDMEDSLHPSGKIITCPWHRYDFSLLTGSSPTGMKACVFEVQIREDRDGEKGVWVEEPEIEDGGGGSWEVAELRPVSGFSDPPPLPTAPPQPMTATTTTTTTSSLSLASLSLTASPSPTAPRQTLPPTLLLTALLILQTPSPSLKLSLTHLALSRLRSGGFRAIRPTRGDVTAARALFAVSGVGESPTTGMVGMDEGEGCGKGFTPPREGVEQVSSFGGPKRGKGGNEKSRVLMLHALANIEQWAIDLAWDIIARFADVDMPVEFYLDFAQMAADEAKHFGLLEKRLREMGSYYGAHTIHASLWESALLTSHSLLSRLAIIHLVAEARGLDVNPLTIDKFRRVGDGKSVVVLEEIHGDEITHVTTGHRWFTYLCQKRSLDPVETFRSLVRQNFKGKLKGPFNEADRARAGMGREYYEGLSGEMGWGGDVGKGKAAKGDAEPEPEGDERIHPRLT